MIVALIPARKGSQRIPGKNLQMLGDAPLIAWSIASARCAKGIGHVVVSSDSDRILETAEGYMADKCLRRPDEFATDDATDFQVVRHYLDTLHDMEEPELIVYLRPTTPLRRLAWVEEAILAFQASVKATGLRSVEPMSESCFKSFRVLPGNILATAYTADVDVDTANDPEHKYPETFKANGAVDIINPRMVYNGRLYGNSCVAYRTPPTIEIDTEWDLRIARYMVAIKEGGDEIHFR